MVTRVAGSDTWGSSGDGGPAIDAMFQFNRSVALDKQGNLYVAESGGHRIRKINLATGIVTRYAGTGTPGYSGDGGAAVNAQINDPWDIAIDANGNLYIAEHYGNRIRKVDATSGIISTYAGTGMSASSGDGGLAVDAGLYSPTSLYIDAKGNLYFTENGPGTGRVRRVDAVTGIISTIAGNNQRAHTGDGGPAVNASLLEPTGVAVDAAGNIYISEYVDPRIRKIDAATGVINTVVGTGVVGFSGDFGLATNAQIEAPLDLAFDNKGDLLICDSRNLRIRKLHMAPPFPPDARPEPVIRITSPSTLACGGSSIRFSATTAYDVAGSWFVWTKNGQVVGADSIQWTGTGLNPGDVIMCWLHFPVCIGTTKVFSNTITITGSSSLPLSVSVSANKEVICKNDTVTFNARVSNGSAGIVYKWKLNSIVTGVTDSVFRTATLIDGDVVSCEVSVPAVTPCFSGATANSNSIAIRIRNSPIPLVNISASSQKICAGAEVSFNAVVRNADTTYSIQWRVNGLAAGSNSERFGARSLSNNDVVTCILTSADGCIAPVPSNAVVMAVEDPPLIRLMPADTVVNVGSTVQLRAAVTGAASYTWTPAVSLSGTNTLTPVTLPLQRTTLVTLKARSPGNCADSATAKLRVEQKLFMPSAFTPNNDAKNDVFRIPPNTTMDLKDFSIFNAWGQKVFSTSEIDRGWDGTVKGVPQNSGTYIYVVVGTDAQGPVYRKGTFQLIR